MLEKKYYHDFLSLVFHGEFNFLHISSKSYMDFCWPN